MRILVTGATGQLGSYLVPELLGAGLSDLVLWSRSTAGRLSGLEVHPIDLADGIALKAALDRFNPDTVIHAAAISSAEQVRMALKHASAINFEATGLIAAWCGDRGRRLVFTSTDMVFDGSRGWYREDDETTAENAYGATKAVAEPLVARIPGGLVARLPLLYGPSRAGRPSFFDRAISGLKALEPQTFFEDEFRTPLDYATAARILVALVSKPVSGILHLGGRERVSRYELMKRVTGTLGLDPGLVRANRRQDARLAEPRPADVSLDTSRLGSLLPDLERPSIEMASQMMQA